MVLHDFQDGLAVFRQDVPRSAALVAIVPLTIYLQRIAIAIALIAKNLKNRQRQCR